MRDCLKKAELERGTNVGCRVRFLFCFDLRETQAGPPTGSAPWLPLTKKATAPHEMGIHRYSISWSGQEDVPVLGPEDISCSDMAQTLSDVLGRPVRYQQIPFEALKSQISGQGATDAMAQGMVDMMIAKNEGLDQAVARTPEGTTPTSFRQWCEEELKPAFLS